GNGIVEMVRMHPEQVTLALSLNGSVGRGARGCSVAPLPRSRRPFSTRSRLRRHPMVNAGQRVGEFPGADGVRASVEHGCLFPARPGLDLFVLSWRGDVVADSNGTVDSSPMAGLGAGRGGGARVPTVDGQSKHCLSRAAPCCSPIEPDDLPGEVPN